MNAPARILLTGATGFIGSHILEALRTDGRPVAVLARPQSHLAHARALGAEIRVGDLCDPSSLRAAVRGCTQVIHAAALANDWAPRADFQRANVTGTLNLLESCRLEGVPHVLLTGSISSYGEEDCPRPKDENSPFQSHYPYFLDRIFPSGFNAYRDSKAQATQQAMAFAREHHMPLTVLEPVWVYGEREFHTGFYSYLKAVQSGQRWMPGSTRNLFHVIYAGDLARAYLLACDRPPVGIERFIIGNPAPEPMHRLFGLLCDEAGLPRPRLLPKWAIYPVGLALELCSTLVRSAHAPLLTRGRVNMFYDSIQFSTEKARRTLGFECQYSLEAGLRRTVAWYKQSGLL